MQPLSSTNPFFCDLYENKLKKFVSRVCTKIVLWVHMKIDKQMLSQGCVQILYSETPCFATNMKINKNKIMSHRCVRRLGSGYTLFSNLYENRQENVASWILESGHTSILKLVLNRKTNVVLRCVWRLEFWHTFFLQNITRTPF